jgi:hypothetical protein
MADTERGSERGEEEEAPMRPLPPRPLLSASPGDPRKPYEAPRLLKKRSVARATLFTAMGPMMSGLTTMG